jgi:hypothetical protein
VPLGRCDGVCGPVSRVPFSCFATRFSPRRVVLSTGLTGNSWSAGADVCGSCPCQVRRCPGGGSVARCHSSAVRPRPHPEPNRGVQSRRGGSTLRRGKDATSRASACWTSSSHRCRHYGRGCFHGRGMKHYMPAISNFDIPVMQISGCCGFSRAVGGLCCWPSSQLADVARFGLRQLLSRGRRDGCRHSACPRPGSVSVTSGQCLGRRRSML